MLGSPVGVLVGGKEGSAVGDGTAPLKPRLVGMPFATLAVVKTIYIGAIILNNLILLSYNNLQQKP